MKTYSDFGVALKGYRVAANESVEDVAGAVEVDPKYIEKMERGDDRPEEDILELLISHFSLRENEAMRLWELAGYAKEYLEGVDVDKESDNDEIKKVNINVPTDSQVLYTDMVHVVSNKYGVILNFVQGLGPNGQPTVVSRVGMSHEHAKSVLEVLKKTLDK